MIPARWYGELGTWLFKHIFPDMIGVLNEKGQMEVVVFARSKFHLSQAIPAIEYAIKESQQQDTNVNQSNQVDKKIHP